MNSLARIVSLDSVRHFCSKRLERGLAWSPVLAAASRSWAHASAARVCKPLTIPAGLRVVGVGGSVLGGAGKTPVAIAIARAIARTGQSVAFIGHGYRAEPHTARRVTVSDSVFDVGDDALFAARHLEADRIPVVVASTRTEALAFAAALGARVAVMDGTLQSAPTRVTDAILVLDGAAPWGAGRCPPLGDLRAPANALLAAADHIAMVRRPAAIETASKGPPAFRAAFCPEDLAAGGLATDPRVVPLTEQVGDPIGIDGERVNMSRLGRSRVGLLLAVARPDRIERALAARSVHPVVAITRADHAHFDLGDARLATKVDVWVTTGRCATKLPPRIGDAPVVALEHHLDVGRLVDRLRAICPEAAAARERLQNRA